MPFWELAFDRSCWLLTTHSLHSAAPAYPSGTSSGVSSPRATLYRVLLFNVIIFLLFGPCFRRIVSNKVGIKVTLTRINLADISFLT